MEIIKQKEATQGTNADNCNTLEYSFSDKKIDLGVAIIKGRYPESGFCMNTKCKELIYVVEGSGILYFDNSNTTFSQGDSVLINKNEKYYWESNYCKVAMICTPAFSKEQYKLVE